MAMLRTTGVATRVTRKATAKTTSFPNMSVQTPATR
jgi:hypothetical protein